jgi:hypothetical protein
MNVIIMAGFKPPPPPPKLMKKIVKNENEKTEKNDKNEITERDEKIVEIKNENLSLKSNTETDVINKDVVGTEVEVVVKDEFEMKPLRWALEDHNVLVRTNIYDNVLYILYVLSICIYKYA